MYGTDVVETSTDASTDGRHARRERGRQAVLDAGLRLIARSGIPSTDDLAREAGVSTSSLFRYFDGVDDILHRVADRFHEKNSHVFDATPEPGSSFDQRVVAFVDVRLTAASEIAPLIVRSQVRLDVEPRLVPIVTAFRRRLAEQVPRFFEPELASFTPAARDDMIAILDAATNPMAWTAMTQVHGRSPTQVKRAWRTLLRELLLR